MFLHVTDAIETHTISPHEVSSDPLFADTGCGSDPDMLSQVVLVYPSAIDAVCSCCIRVIQFLLDEVGWFSWPDRLSHEP